MYIVSYDITNKKRLKKVANTCLKYLSRVQKSVFEGGLTISQLNMLKKEFKQIIDHETDSILIYFLRDSSLKKRIIFGKPIEDPFLIQN